MTITEELFGDNLSVRVTRDGSVVTLSVYGELDMASAGLLAEQLGLAEDSDAEQIVLDLSELEFIDSTGLATIAAASRRSSENGNKLAGLRARHQVKRVFEITGIDQIVTWLD
jgi:anti-sigma B factor antagonist